MPHSVDIGVIELWSGSLGSIPPGWALCDGTNGTPDMRDQFSYAASPAVQPGDSFDFSTHTHDFTGDSHQHEVTPISTPINALAARANVTDPSPTTGTTDPTQALPPYYSLAYVMFIGT